MDIASIKQRFPYKTRLLLSLTSAFAAFAVALILFQQHRESTYREEILASRLHSYANIVAEAIEAEGLKHDSAQFQEALRIFPEDLRLSVITRQGVVKYDSSPMEASDMPKHKNRPEILQALSQLEGSDIRTSETTGDTYYYYAKSYGSFVVRVAVPYDKTVKDFMQADHTFIWFVLLLSPLVFFILFHLANQSNKSISLLRHFIKSADKGLVDYDNISFPHSELGELGQSILKKYQELEQSNHLIANERERFLRHFHYFEEGVAIFNHERQKIYANPIFLQYVNTILDQPTANINSIWEHQAFAPAAEFLTLNGGNRSLTEEAPIFRFNISAGSTFYAVQLLIYSDGGFEMTLSDVTRAEKSRKLKQQMSNNITHELRTPVSSIRGYIETILNCPGLTDERKLYFLSRAHTQIIRLTDLIRDVALITKVEEAPETMPLENIDVHQIVEDIIEELRADILDAKINIINRIPEKTILKGNYSLVYSIFRNLFENSVRYAGPDTEICAECYNIDDKFCYFRCYDTGQGVAEEHLSRLFERFYRVSEGRTRDGGGTGLGLSIVRNAVNFHQGNITVRNRKEGGLEFLFTLKR